MDTIDSALWKIGFGKFHVILIVISGIILSGDAVEMLLMTILSPILKCLWNINGIEISFMTIGVFIGIIVGGLFFGRIGDEFGRKVALMIGNVGLIYFAVLGAFSPTAFWFILIRCFIGIFVGGNSSTLFTLISEVISVRYRGTMLVVFQLFWGLGSYWASSLSFFLLSSYRWRLLLLITLFPTFCATLMSLWIPESPRYLLLKNEKAKCLEVLNRIAKLNNAKPITNIEEAPNVNTSIQDLIHKDYLSTTIFMTYLWTLGGITYLSIILLITNIDSMPHRCLQDFTKLSIIKLGRSNSSVDDSCCVTVTSDSYVRIFISTTAELIFLPITIICINWLGRKNTFLVYLIVIVIGLVLINLCLDQVELNILLFFSRGSIGSFTIMLFIYTSEVYPTSVRLAAVGIFNSCSKFGSILAPFAVNLVIERFSLLIGTMGLVIMNVLGLCFVLFLPFETKDRKLFQFADERDTEEKLLNSAEVKSYESVFCK